MSYYIFKTFEKMIFNLDDKNTTVLELNQLDESSVINYNETDLFNFYVIRKQLPHDTPLFLSDELSRYVDISIRQVTLNWKLKEDGGRYIYREYQVRQCTKEDFGEHEKDQESFK